jgi:hypothetical protein
VGSPVRGRSATGGGNSIEDDGMNFFNRSSQSIFLRSEFSNYMMPISCTLRPAALKPLEMYLLVWDFSNMRWVRQDNAVVKYRYKDVVNPVLNKAHFGCGTATISGECNSFMISAEPNFYKYDAK